ncbi:hypothetical protein ARMGADRAFT_1031890 [Armillaria gallica]|uniref:Uncharacterized protein n=1 Tax=Armillaria gallica TaxID=47427 RepID=A0A2H3D7K2_ARMGA|nr:hypothetical protein ARMGADRAFT_1031890 [Armillaria gallica]
MSKTLKSVEVKLLQIADEGDAIIQSSLISMPSQTGDSEQRWSGSAHKNLASESTEWSNRILACASLMMAGEINELKSRCNPSVWATLVFANIRKTPARALNDLNIGKVKIVDWDLFPSLFVDKIQCVNCDKKRHACQRQSAGVQKCRECTLFQLSCLRPVHLGAAGHVLLDGPPSKKRKWSDEPITRRELDSIKANIDSLRRSLEMSITTYNKLRTSLTDTLIYLINDDVINFTNKSDFDAALHDFLPDRLQPTSPRWLASLLATNDPPTLRTRHSLLTALDIHEEESDKLDAKLSDSIHLLDFIADQALAAKTHVRNIKTVTHPIYIVPDEVWRKIHLFAIAGSVTTCPSIYNTIWRLAQCRQGFFNSLELLHISDMEYYESPTVTYDEHALDAFFFLPKMTLFDIPDIPVMDLALAPAANASIWYLDSAELYEPALVAMLWNLLNVAVLELRSTNMWPLIVEELCNHGECLLHFLRLLYLVEYLPENSEAANFVWMLHHRKYMSSCTHIIHLSVFGNPIMDQFTRNEWDILLDDRAHLMELMRVPDG